MKDLIDINKCKDSAAESRLISSLIKAHNIDL